MPDFFRNNVGVLDLAAQNAAPNRGFRSGQLGALHAVLAHASVHDDPAIVCLPTGYGKTSVMMALPILMQSRRVLIVEPSNALRKQVSSHFRELSTLRRIGAIPADLGNPNVLTHDTRPASRQDWEALEAYDVVVSTPSSSSPNLAAGSPDELFDLIIFDEAHHAPAESWAAYLTHYQRARFVFLTATPFRRDGRLIPGKLVYRYPVMRAVDEGAFVPVSFRAAPVQDDLDNRHVDRVIAEAAVAQLRDDREAGFDHRLFARAATILAARDLVPLYRDLGIAVEAVDSKISKRAQADIEARLISGELDGIVCVDMFGEGYDFPKLKVAALHAPHRSIVPTIQFIGRFARVDAATGAATLVAPVSRIHAATEALLKEGVDLARMIDQAALAELQGDAEELAVLENLQVSSIAESDYEAVSPLALQLYAHARIFHCVRPPDLTQVGEMVGKQLRVVKHWLSVDGKISLLLTTDRNPPNWATSDVLVNLRHDAFLFVCFEGSGMCFIGSTRRTEKLYLGLMDKVCPQGYRALSYEETSRARAGLSAIRFFNVGLKNAALNSQGETYRTLTGPQAERAVTAGDGRAYVQGHFFGSGVDGEERETIGASSTSKIWSNQRLSVAEYIEWAGRLNSRIVGAANLSATQLDVVRAAITLRQVPDSVIAATWPKHGFKLNPKIRFRRVGEWSYRRLTEWDFSAFTSDPVAGNVDFVLSCEDAEFGMRFSIGQGRMVSARTVDLDVEVESASDEWMPLVDWLSEHPPVFYSADKSSFEGMNYMAPPAARVEALGEGDAESMMWDRCDISVEFLPGDASDATRQKRQALEGRLTVQERLEEALLARDNLLALFYDHRSGEAADYIAVTTAGDEVEIGLYHCKGAGGPVSGGRVSDVYELAGQLVKSVAYCNVETLLSHMARRMHARNKFPSRFIRGDLDALKNRLAETLAINLRFSVAAVQPGISKRLVDEHLADLMLFCINYVRQGGATRAYWLVSD